MPDKEEKAKPDAKAADAKQDKKAAKADKKAEKPDKKADKPDKKAKDDKKTDDKAAKGDKKADDKAAKADGDKKGEDAKADAAAGKKGKAAKGAKGAKGEKGAKDKKADEPQGNKFMNFFKKLKPKPKSKKPKAEKPKVPYVDKPEKPEMSSPFVHKAVQLDKKDNQFLENQFQKVRKVSNIKRNIEAFHRIGMCMNDADLSELPTDCLGKVCLILMNTYPREPGKLGVGPTNDAYLCALIHHKLGYKIAFLINPDIDKFKECLEFFVEKTVLALTIYYSGHDSSSRARRIGHGIQFCYDDRLSSTEFGEIVGGKSNGQSRILIISDCGCGCSVFNMKAATSTDNAHCSEIVSFSIDKKALTPKERRKTQGLFTYYFCKLIRQFPNSTVKDMVDMLNISFERFREVFTAQLSSDDLNEKPLFRGADAAFNGPHAGNGPNPPAQQAAPPAQQAAPAAAAPAPAQS